MKVVIVSAASGGIDAAIIDSSIMYENYLGGMKGFIRR